MNESKHRRRELAEWLSMLSIVAAVVMVFLALSGLPWLGWAAVGRLGYHPAWAIAGFTLAATMSAGILAALAVVIEGRPKAKPDEEA